MKIPSELNIKKGTIIEPIGGFQDSSYYVVEVAYSSHNPIHRAILYTGFNLGSYSAIFCQGSVSSVEEVYYLKGLKEIEVK